MIVMRVRLITLARYQDALATCKYLFPLLRAQAPLRTAYLRCYEWEFDKWTRCIIFEWVILLFSFFARVASD